MTKVCCWDRWRLSVGDLFQKPNFTACDIFGESAHLETLDRNHIPLIGVVEHLLLLNPSIRKEACR